MSMSASKAPPLILKCMGVSPWFIEAQRKGCRWCPRASHAQRARAAVQIMRRIAGIGNGDTAAAGLENGFRLEGGARWRHLPGLIGRTMRWRSQRKSREGTANAHSHDDRDWSGGNPPDRGTGPGMAGAAPYGPRSMIGRLLGILLAAIGALLIAAGALYLYSPPKSLDVLNDVFPGDRGARRVAGGVPFMPGPDGKLDIWGQTGATAKPRPVIIFFYGGAWVKGRRGDYGFVGKAYAARGFVVVIPDYRKVPGVRFPAFVEDGARAVRWTRDNIGRFGGDPNHIFLAGHSAGGYIAMMLALDRRYLARVGVDPATIRGVAGLAGAYNFYPFTSARAVAAMGNARDPRQTQPISFARRDAPPLWLATGTADTDVEPRNALTLAAREAALGSHTTVLRAFPGSRTTT